MRYIPLFGLSPKKMRSVHGNRTAAHNSVALPLTREGNQEELVLFRFVNGKGGSIPSATEGNSGKDSATGRSWRTSFPVLALERFQAHHPGLTEVFAFAPFGQITLLIDRQPEKLFPGPIRFGYSVKPYDRRVIPVISFQVLPPSKDFDVR